MLGLMLTRKEAQEIEYLLKKELEELLLDLEDERIEGLVRRAMEERYKLIFRLYGRFVPPHELSKYVRTSFKQG
ncbi:hypothetical protein CathTA2_2491 [Caldalkalibacillus thermarum TA2.A1]|uniref:Uncharacterized protein n=1 Tax=Caldalkalibacillus thermarum (strain TA2.A1) TaxID=986075 RepID=F5L9I6_CALTT|nr:hypothetical protein [Caldalkalibacillus thermarum]EGL81973.1 hypothetical protein CathTA2_2491 [Caldalkalibacillus thermarum TA2.A1]QZT34460.1 hypothetical protein HUR95_03435 [Caldalkalibacillus thermarum TA2.A1]GGK20954.1 hypothetical protein GCM10010965_12560 [Caldalkalibacillus thermarum]